MLGKANIAAVVVLLVVFVGAAPSQAGKLVPFKGHWAGQTVSAAPTDDPNVIFVTTDGGGNATHLGKFTMISPHFSNLLTLEAFGSQFFTAANGDQLEAEFVGQFVPTPDGFLEAELQATIVGGTGRFENATGHYVFEILFDPLTFESIASIRGKISRP